MKLPPNRSSRCRPGRLASSGLLALLVPVLSAQDKGLDLSALVNPKNSTLDVPRAELTRLFRAETRYWKNGRRVEILLPRSGSHEKDFLLRNVYRMDEAELKRYWIELIYQNKITAPPKVMPSAAVMQVVLGKQDGGLGIVPTTEVREEGVLSLRVDGKRPGDEGYWLHVEPPGEDDGPEERDRSEGGGDLVTRGGPREAAVPDDEQEEVRRRLEQLEFELAALGESDDLAPTYEFGGLQLRGFGDVTAGARHLDTGDGRGEFALGQLDLFMTARLSEHSHFLAELVFEADQDGATVSDLERLVVTYDLGQNATLRVGRMHTALGLWSARFHHGEWVQTTIERPTIVEFEDDGGLLPVHLIGVSAEGSLPFEALELEGFLQVGNGRAPTPGRTQASGDENDTKCVNLQLSAKSPAVPGLVLGGGLYVDKIPPNADAAAAPLHGELDEDILSAFGAWSDERTSILAEYYRIEHGEGSTRATSDGWFVQLEHELGSWTPYLRYESSSIADGDPYYSSTTDEDRVVLGVRWDFSTWNAFKLQLESGTFDEVPDEDYTAVLFQTAFAF